MEQYSGFAQVYDLFMDDIPYDEWCEYVCTYLKETGMDSGIVLDLGCGTGELTTRMAQRGYDMIGVDLSPEMLNHAMEKRESLGLDILYLMQDMREFELYGTVGAVVSVCDSLNYVTEEEDLLEVFRLVNNYLDPGGLFIFDLNTAYKYEQIGNATITDEREDAAFIWDNTYDAQEKLNEYDMTFFVRKEGELFERIRETHYERAYDENRVKSLLEEAGLCVVGVYDGFTKNQAKENSERVTFVAKEVSK